jgi:MinD superfamily P-loop ATPase
MMEGTWLPHIDLLTCTGCGDCVAACQPQAIALVNAKAFVVRPTACSYCGSCEQVCPVGAIALPYLVVFDEAEQARRLRA